MCEGWDEDHGRGCVGLDIHLKELRDCFGVALGRDHRLLLAAVSIWEEVVRRLGSDVVRQGAGVYRVNAFGNPSSMVEKFPLICAQNSVSCIQSCWLCSQDNRPFWMLLISFTRRINFIRAQLQQALIELSDCPIEPETVSHKISQISKVTHLG